MATTQAKVNAERKVSKGMINANDAVMLLIDHQAGLFQLVRDIEQTTLRNNVIALAKISKLANLPTFTTASVPQGPNGPLIPEIHECNPQAVYIPRTGQINAWDNPEYVKAIEKTGKKTLIIAGTLTSVCMAFPALSAVEAGYKVFCVIDASGNHSKMATETTIARMAQAGVVTVDTFAVMSEIMGTWNRTDSWQFANVMMEHCIPSYRALVDCYKKEDTMQVQGATGEKKTQEGTMNQLGKLSAGVNYVASS
jgi:nicotinamidase-related amidase